MLKVQNGIIAQLVEQKIEDLCVPSSILGDTTIKFIISEILIKVDKNEYIN